MTRRRWALVLLLALVWATPALAGPRCLTYAERALNRLHTVCSDGTRGISTYSKAPKRWETRISPPLTSSQPKWRHHPKDRRP